MKKRLTARNDQGYLVYDMEAQKRIVKVKMYQEFGFSIKEIVAIIDAPEAVLKAALMGRLEQLRKDQVGMEVVIQRICEMIECL